MKLSLLLLQLIYYINGDHVFNWCKEYITFNMNSKIPTIVTDSPTIVTDFPYIENESRTNTAIRYWFYVFDRDEYYKRYINQ